ncbi:hypothetical protein SAMN04488026_101924 [Aliiruegeria lutimaris]|uniref:Integrase core domain-containing protein n=1 Tax=Aliiruegeria lutimaris TaxID=571298 RepID=A0A1G8UHW2_9RHOB|nr:hypothetical protein SAMN04488026_101924 [Aliiruegeria lutimaris]
MDFVHDELVAGRKIRVLNIVDTYSRFSPATDPQFSYRGEDMVRTLERVCKEVRPHSAIGSNPPLTLMNGSGTVPPS